MGYYNPARVEPMILDASIDKSGGGLRARDTEDHRVFLPENQILCFNTDTGELKTILEG